jgi:hypothetical protein
MCPSDISLQETPRRVRPLKAAACKMRVKSRAKSLKDYHRRRVVLFTREDIKRLGKGYNVRDVCLVGNMSIAAQIVRKYNARVQSVSEFSFDHLFASKTVSLKQWKITLNAAAFN